MEKVEKVELNAVSVFLLVKPMSFLAFCCMFLSEKGTLPAMKSRRRAGTFMAAAGEAPSWRLGVTPCYLYLRTYVAQAAHLLLSRVCVYC